MGSSFEQVVWANWSLREPSEFDTFYEEWLRWFDGEAPVGQGTLMPLSHRRAGFRVSVGVIAATEGGQVDVTLPDATVLIAGPGADSMPEDGPSIELPAGGPRSDEGLVT